MNEDLSAAKGESQSQIIYAGFWRRFLAVFIDILVLLPFIQLFIWLDSISRIVALSLAVPSAGLLWAYDFYLHGKYGQTLGKWAARIQVRRLNGMPIGWRESFLRSSVYLVFTMIFTAGGMYGLLQISSYEYINVPWRELGSHLSVFRPVFYEPVDTMLSVWLWSEVVVLLFNRKKRALHDFIAGTVVVHKASIPERLPIDLPPETAAPSSNKQLIKIVALAVGLGFFLHIGLNPTLVHWGSSLFSSSVVLYILGVAIALLGATAKYWVAALAAGLLVTRRRAVWSLASGATVFILMLMFLLGRHALACAFPAEVDEDLLINFIRGSSRPPLQEMILSKLYEDTRFIDTSWGELWRYVKADLLYAGMGLVVALIFLLAVALVRRMCKGRKGRIISLATISVPGLTILVLALWPAEGMSPVIPRVVMELRLVKLPPSPASESPLELLLWTPLVFVIGDMPPDREVDLPDSEFVGATIFNSTQEIRIHTTADVAILNTEIRRAKATSTEWGLQVQLELNAAGTERMHKFTKDNLGRMIAVSVDGRVFFAAKLAEEIFSRPSIAGNFTTREARELAKFLTGEIETLQF